MPASLAAFTAFWAASGEDVSHDVDDQQVGAIGQLGVNLVGLLGTGCRAPSKLS
jgi:hypothetical protein